MMQKEVDMRKVLKQYCTRLIESINRHFAQEGNMQDPLDFITATDGQWLFNNPLLPPDYTTRVITLATKQLSDKIYHIDNSYHCNNDDNNIYFYLNKQRVIRWKLSTNQVSVPLFRKIYENQQQLAQLEQQLADIKQQLYEAKLVLSNPDSLIDHGMYIAYLKATITKRRYRDESKLVINNLVAKQNDLLSQITLIQHEAKQLTDEQKTIDQYIHQIELSTAGFPYQVSYQKYLKAKSRMKQDEKSIQN